MSGLADRNVQTWFGYLEPVAYAAVMAVALKTVATSAAGLWTGLALGLPAAVLGVWAAVDTSQTVAVLQGVAAAAFLFFVAIRVVGHLLHCEVVDGDTLCASASAYLVFGVAWAAMFSMVYDLDPTAFDIDGPAGERSLSFSSRHSIHVLYFSFVTLTTLGYGDVVPISAPARVLAMLEAVVGQLYLAVLVARLVGLHLHTRAIPDGVDAVGGEPKDDGGPEEGSDG